MSHSSIPWNKHRDSICLNPNVIQLNAGSCSPLPKKVLAKSIEYRTQLAHDPSYFLTQFAFKEIETSRNKLAQFLSCDAKNLLFFPNVSHAVNLILQKFPFKKDSQILTTSEEYPHYWSLFKELETSKGLQFKRIKIPFHHEEELDKDALLNLFKKNRTKNTTALYFSHVSCQTGLTFPVHEICKWAQEEGLMTIIDGAHAAGFVPLDLSSLQCSFYTANIHKWMMGVTGSAFLYTQKEQRKDLEPLCWTAGYPFTDADKVCSNGLTQFANAFEYQGTRDPTPCMCVGTSLDLFKNITLEQRRERSFDLRKFCIEKMEETGFTLISQNHPDLSSCLLSFNFPHKIKDPMLLRTKMRDQYKVDLNFPNFEDGSFCVRFSMAWFNTHEEIEKAISSLLHFYHQGYLV